MAISFQDIISTIEALAPPGLAEPWDSVGLQVGVPELPVNRILLAVDVTRRVVDEAARISADVIVAHHPVLFGHVATLRPDRWPGWVVAPLIAAGRGLYVAHTNLDTARATNTSVALARALGLGKLLPLEPSTGHEPGVTEAEENISGIGVLAATDHITLERAATDVKTALGIHNARVADAGRRDYSRVAVVAGSAKSSLAAVLAADAHMLIAGEIGHHGAIEAAASGVSSIEVGHFTSEQPAMARLGRMLQDEYESRVGVVVSDDASGAFDIR